MDSWPPRLKPGRVLARPGCPRPSPGAHSTQEISASVLSLQDRKQPWPGTPRDFRERMFKDPHPHQGSLPTGQSRDDSACPRPAHSQPHHSPYIPRQVTLKLQQSRFTAGPRRAGGSQIPLGWALFLCQPLRLGPLATGQGPGLPRLVEASSQPWANLQTDLEFQLPPTDRRPSKAGLGWSSEELSAAGAE